MADIIIKAVQTDEELRQANDLMARRHFIDYEGGVEWLGGHGQGGPGYLREHTRIAVEKGHVVAALRLVSDTLRLGEARLKMGGLSCVSADITHGNRGVIGRVVSDAVQYMQQHQYHVAMLFGIQDYYHRWGFAAALDEYATLVKSPESGPLIAAPFRIRAAKPSDIPAMQKMHARNDAETACSVLRTNMHLANKWREITPLFMLANQHGKAMAYFRGMRQGHDFMVDEMGVTDETSCDALIQTALRMTREQFLERVSFLAAPNHPVVMRLAGSQPAHDTARVRKSEGMMAFMNLSEALESMIPEWESQLVRSSLTRLRTEVTLLVQRVALRVRVNHGAVSIVPGTGENKLSLSSRELMQLTTGYRLLNDILDERRRIIDVEGRMLLTALFPKRDPYVWRLDRF